MCLDLYVYKGSRRLHTLKIMCEIVHQSVLVVMSQIGDDLTH